MHIAVDGGRIHFRSFEKAWKTRRIRRDPRIEIAPSTVRGEPTGLARILDGEAAKGAARAIGRRYPIIHRWLIPWAHRLMGAPTVHVEALARAEPADRPITPADRDRVAPRVAQTARA